MSHSDFDRLFEDRNDAITGTEIGPYEICELLSDGDYCSVYRAIESNLGRMVALKIIKPGPWVSPQIVSRLEQEGRILAQLKHPNVVQLYGVFQYEDRPCLAMEFVQGGTLQQCWPKTPLDLATAIELLLRIARGVAAAHARGIVHRDIKPANVLLDVGMTPTDLETAYGFVKVTDFGIAKLLDGFESLTMTGQGQPGTWAYMAPEQVEGDSQRIGPQTDVHALGVLAYLLVTGRNPFDYGKLRTTIDKIRTWTPPPPSEYIADLPAWFDQLCEKCVAKNPQHRPADAHVLAQALNLHLSELRTAARPIPHKATVHPPTVVIAKETQLISPKKTAEAPVQMIANRRRKNDYLQRCLLAVILLLIFVICIRFRLFG